MGKFETLNTVNKNIVPHNYVINRVAREKSNGHKSKVIWFTGLSGSGKSTLANALEEHLFRNTFQTYLLDGDNVRSGINSDLDFSTEGRTENIRRISEVSKLFLDAGVVVLCAFVSPLNADRSLARSIIGDRDLIEVFVDCPLEVCESRDVKGLYAKARQGLIPNFTGISAPFEQPTNPDVIIDTANQPIDEAVTLLVSEIIPKI